MPDWQKKRAVPSSFLNMLTCKMGHMKIYFTATSPLFHHSFSILILLFHHRLKHIFGCSISFLFQFFNNSFFTLSFLFFTLFTGFFFAPSFDPRLFTSLPLFQHFFNIIFPNVHLWFTTCHLFFFYSFTMISKKNHHWVMIFIYNL